MSEEKIDRLKAQADIIYEKQIAGKNPTAIAIIRSVAFRATDKTAKAKILENIADLCKNDELKKKLQESAARARAGNSAEYQKIAVKQKKTRRR
ncbi:MAG: hypothetical protein V1911_03215 [Candidatus Micrarchaeota archaeon]